MSDAPAPKPADSNIDLIAAGDTLTVSVPPSGYRGGARAMLAFAIFWNLFCLFFIAMVVAALLFPQHVKGEGSPVVGLLVMIPFLAIGVGALAGARHFARRKAVILLTPDTLVFTQTGPLRQVEKSWPRGELAAVAVGPSGTEINNRPLLQIQFRFTTGKHYGILTGRPEAELYWLAGELARAIGTPA